MCLPMFERKMFVPEDDYANIDSLMVIDEAVNQFNI